MRIINKMKKAMLVLAASLFSANVAFADVIFSANFDGESAQPIGGWGNNSTREVVDGAMKMTNPSVVNPWEAQTAQDFASNLEMGQTYTLKFKVKGSAEGSFTANLRVSSTYAGAGDFGTISFTTEWKDVELTTVCNSSDANSLIFNYGNFAGDIFMDDIELSFDAPLAPKTWVSVIANGDFEGEGSTSFVAKENGGANAGAFLAPAIADGIGKDGSRGIKVTSYKGAKLEWDAQFWIAAAEGLPAGTEFRVAFDYRASAAIAIGTQAHGEPGAYQHWDAIGAPSFTTEWQHYEKSGLVSAEMAGANGFKSIAFNLSKDTLNDVEFFFDNVTFEVVVSEEEIAMTAAVDSLNKLIAEAEAWKATLKAEDEMHAQVLGMLDQMIPAAKAVAEAPESLDVVNQMVFDVYATLGTYKPMIEQYDAKVAASAAIEGAKTLLATYTDYTDEAGFVAAIAAAENALTDVNMGMATLADLSAAVEAMVAAQEAFVAENAKADNMAVVKSWDFAAMADTMTVSDMYMTYSEETVKVGGTASNLGTGVWEGLAMQGANKYFIRTKTGGLYQGNGGGRKVGILDLVPGQKVTIVTDGECMTLADTTNVELLSMQTADGKTTYEYAITAEGMLALTMTRYFSIFSIVVEQPAAMLETAYWDFAAIADTMTVSDLYMTYSDETVSVGGTASNLGTGIWNGLAMQGANKFFIRTKTGGLYQGNGGGRKVGVLDLKKASVVTIVTDGECMSLADATVAEQTSMETVDGKTTYVYTMVEDGTLALTMTRYFSIFSIKVESLVKYVAAPNWDFAAMADTMTVADMYMTYSDETVSVGGTASNLGTGVWNGLAMQGANKFFIRTKTGGLYQGNGGGRKVGILNMTAGSTITIVTDGECMSLADATVAEQTSMETVDGKTTYVYTMTGDGTLALTMTRYFSIFSINVLAVQADIKAPTIDATKNTDDVVTVTLACETKDAVIYYSLDGGADSLYKAPFQLAKTSLVKAYSVSADGKNTSKVTEKEVVAGFINAPTATITAVNGLNRTVTLASATEGASIIYATSALEEAALTKEEFHKWNGVGADAQPTEEATTPELGVGAELGAGAMVYGYSTVDYLHYADLTGAAKLVIEGTPGVQLRVLMNRVEHEGALIEKNPVIGENGKAEVDFAGMEYVHLNAIKTGWGSPAGTITKLAVARAKEGFEAYTEPFVISDNTTVWAIASKKSAIVDTLTFASDTLVAELAAGVEIALNAPTFAKAVVDSLTQIEYAEKNLSAYMINSDQSSVLCAPTATISYEFYPLNAETGRIAETASLVGEYTDTLFALPLGKLVAKVSAEGYASTEAYTWLKAPAVLTPVWEIDFDTLAFVHASAGDLAPTMTDVVFNGKFRANATSDFSNVAVNGEPLNPGFVLQTGTSWLLRTAADSYGLYNYNSGDRAFGFAGLKKNQVVKISYQDAVSAIFTDGVIEQDLANTNGNDVCYNVTADGNATIGMSRYYTLHKVGVYMSSALTQTPDFAITKVDGNTHYVGMTTGTLGADIYYAIGHEEYNSTMVLDKIDTTLVEGVEVYDTTYVEKIDTVVVYGENKLYTEPVALDETSYVRAYAWYQDVESEAREQLIEAGFTVQIAQPVILYTGNTEAGEKQFTISVDNSEVISTPTTPIYYTLPGGEETLYDGGTITVKTDVYGWMTAVAKLAGYEDSKAARRYIDARESYTETYAVVDATLETMPTEAGDVEVDYSEEMNVEQLGATAYTGRVYFHRTVDAAVINVSLPSVFNNNCYVTDAAGKKLERGVDYVIYEIKAAERPIQGVLEGNMAATAAKGYVVNFLNAELIGKEVIFVSAVKGNIAKTNFTYAQPAEGYKVVTNRMFAAATLDVPAYVLNAEGTAFELVETGAVVAPFQSVILASADICATVKSLTTEADGIESIATDGKEVKEIKYYTVGGVEVEKPAAGVYVQQIIFTDGTAKTVTVAGK